jgi:Rieske Fe-S protein
VDSKHSEETQQPPGPSLWPLGLAVGIACVLVGLIVSWWIVAVGGGLVILFALLWVRDLARPAQAAPRRPAARPARAARPEAAPARATRKGFLSGLTLGLGALIGGAVTLPPALFAILPPFFKGEGFQDVDVDLGPLDNYPEGQWVVTKFNISPRGGDVNERTAFVRYNGLLDGLPSFTILSNRCVHLGCPVQPNGPLAEDQRRLVRAGKQRVQLIPAQPSGFGCPCHGGQYDIEGNRTAGPPVRALDRYAYAIRNGHLVLTGLYSVGAVEGEGKEARIAKYRLAAPGIHVQGWERVLYPLQPPS